MAKKSINIKRLLSESGILAMLTEMLGPEPTPLSPKAESDFQSYIEHGLPPFLKELELLCAVHAHSPRILILAPAADEPSTWEVLEVLSGQPMLYPEGIESLFAAMDAALLEYKGSLALWHMSIPQASREESIHILYLRHQLGDDAQMLVRGGDLVSLPVSSEPGRSLVHRGFYEGGSRGEKVNLMAPFQALRKSLEGKRDSLNCLLIAKGLTPLAADDVRLDVLAEWVLSEEHMYPVLLPFLRAWSRDERETSVTSMARITLTAAERALELLKIEGEKLKAEHDAQAYLS